MLRKGTSQRDCISNYSQSLSNLHSPPHSSFDLKKFCLRKSLFNPSESLLQSFDSRRLIAGADVPIIEVVHYTKRWLLLQTSRFSLSFFKRLNSGRLGNPFQQLLKVFKSLVALTRIYGYFKPTAEMILMDSKIIRVWTNEDIFSQTPMMKLSQGIKGQRQFVISFLLMIEEQFRQWKRTSNIFTIEDTIRILESRSQMNRQSFTTVKQSKQVFFPPNESNASFEPYELGDLKKLKACRSVQQIQIKQSQQYFQAILSSSMTVKEQQQKKQVQQLPNQKKKIFGLFSDSKDLKNSFHDSKAVQFNNEVRRTKKKFNLTSTSSTLQRFSEKWRLTVGKKTKKVESPQINTNDRAQTSLPHLQRADSLPISIQHEVQSLFQEDEENRELKFAVEGDREQLQKIAEQIQQVLIW